MAQIKETVELLTKILRHNGTSKIKSEVFRQAKFDKNEATEPMWKLLFEIIYYLKYRKIDDITIKAYSELTREELCTYVKTEMKMRGFVSKTFHELGNDMSSGSRELLLAFGWLMCRSGLVELFMEQCCIFLEGFEDLGQQNGKSTSVKPNRSSRPKASVELRDKVSYLMWLNGKLRLNLRNVHALQKQKDKLTEKVHTLTQGVSVDPSRRDHLTVIEVMMLKNPELLKKNMKLLDADNQRLEALIAWQQHEEIFWKWMESVLDVKIAESGLIEEVDSMITPRTQSTKQQLDLKLQIAESVRKYDAIVTQLENDIASRQCTEAAKMEDIDRLLSEINVDIALHVNKLLENVSHYDRMNSDTANRQAASMTPVARIKPLRRQESRASSITSASAAEKEIVSMEKELGTLQSLVARLQADIEYKQGKFQDDLSSVTSGMDSLYEYIARGPMVFNM